jgi:hypothetical protein
LSITQTPTWQHEEKKTMAIHPSGFEQFGQGVSEKLA